MILVAACWAIAPALICERRLRTLAAGRGWGLVIGGLLGPLGVAVVNIYISEQCVALLTSSTHAQRHPRLASHLRNGELRLSMRGDILALACLWAAVLLGSILFALDNVSSDAQVATRKAGHTQLSSIPAQKGSSEALQVSTPTVTSAEDLSLQTLNRAARATTPGGTMSSELTRSNENSPATPLPTAGSESTAITLPATQPTQSNSSVSAPSAGTGATGVALGPPVNSTVTAAASTTELMRLVVPSNFKAHGTISGAGSATTLTIACADCTYALGAERLSSASTRATLKTAGVRVVVLINGQDSWTFML